MTKFVTSRDTLLDKVYHVVGKAAWCAAEFKLSDPTSITETRHCVQDCYEAARAEYLQRVSDASTARQYRAELLWDEVRVLLHSIGFTW